MINLFEYQNKQEFKGDFDRLEIFLDDIWKKREKSSMFAESGAETMEVQRFLQFIRKTNELKSNKYVGVIHFEGRKINLLPKIFYDAGGTYSPEAINCIQNHILWWLSYCGKIRFPNYRAALDSLKSDFFEVLIYMFARCTRELLSGAIYQQYEEVSRELPFIKGGLNINGYISENLSKGRWHKISCTYDSFAFDNKFNRIIKYVTTLLFHETRNSENKRILREILFIFDEVSDVRMTASDCAAIRFNPIFSNFETVRDYCYLFLNNSVSFDYKNELKLFAFLIPMEYLFEDFISGFIDREMEDIKARAQSSSTYLDQTEKYALRPDLILKTDSKTVIVDTKYKIIYADEKGPKRGVSQSDLYQMLAYAVRFNIGEIILFYPDTIQAYHETKTEIVIRDELAGGAEVSVTAFQLPVINRALFNQTEIKKIELDELFANARNSLKARLEAILDL